VDVRWHETERAGARLRAADYGGDGPPVLLLHGLAGHAREWDSTALWLTASHRVVAPDARAHGGSERCPADVSPAAFADDAAHWIEWLDLAPAVVIGQSFGGLTALLVTARRPDLVRRLVVAEATPAKDPGGIEIVRRWLATWPLPFRSSDDALEFFGGHTLWARAWTAGLEQRRDGLRPAFDPEVVLAALAQANGQDHWRAWAAIRAPTLVVRAGAGVSRGETQEMLDLLPHARLEQIAGSGHDVHLDAPGAWREALEAFLPAPAPPGV
jgi:pimeloyl-ACP methyl ester carboxylesterase